MFPPRGLACKNLTVPVNVDVPHSLITTTCPPSRKPTCPNSAVDVSQTSCQSRCLTAPSHTTTHHNAYSSCSSQQVKPMPHMDDESSPIEGKNLQQVETIHHSDKCPTREECLASHARRIVDFWPEPTTTARKLFPMFFDTYSRIKATAKPNCFAARIPIDSNLVIPAWRHELAQYHDAILCDYLEFGWPLGYHSDVSPETTKKNHPSGEAHLPHISEFIAKELSHRAVLGPFHQDPFEPWVRYSPIMTRPKRDSHQRRVILDLSFPKGSAVNDGIAVDNHFGQDISYTLPTITDFANRLVTQGKGAFMWKADLSRAYQQLRADPLDAPLLGMRVSSEIFIDLCPPFGCRSSAAICQRMANALVYMMNKRGFHLSAYLDDFGMCFSSENQANASFKAFCSLTQTLGLTLADEKSVPPTHELDWLGYKVNSNTMTITIPPKKLEEVLQDCRAWLNKSRADKRMIQAIAGCLIYISNCILPGRKFTSRILGTLRAMGDRSWTTLTPEFKADLRWFAVYAEKANGLSLLTPRRPTFDIECDASLLGAGGSSSTCCYQWTFSPAHIKNYPVIHHLEAINVVIAIRTLVPQSPTGPLNIIVWTDNSASAWALQTGRTKDSTLAACAREIWLIASIHNHNIVIKHKPGSELLLADALSRAAQNTAKARLAADIISSHALTCVAPVLNDYVFFSSFL